MHRPKPQVCIRGQVGMQCPKPSAVPSIYDGIGWMLRVNSKKSANIMLKQDPPFAAEAELVDSAFITTPRARETPPQLPGHPSHVLQSNSATTKFLAKDLVASELEKMAPKMWMMSRQDPGNISPLHRQKVKGRNIILTEEPKLHLVWYYDRIFVKPLPRYLLCHAFWETFLLPDGVLLHGDQRRLIIRSALGLLRTYHYLIRHESDFRIAQRDDLQLIPKELSWAQYCAFSCHFYDISDEEVSERYHYGEVRLTRLNFYARIFLGRNRYISMTPQYADFFARYYGPFLFTFAILSLSLSGMQVTLAADTPQALTSHVFNSFCRVFGILAVVLTAVTVSIFAMMWTFMVVREWNFAVRERRRLKMSISKGKA